MGLGLGLVVRHLLDPFGLYDLEGGAVGQVKADDGRARAAAIEAREAVEALLVGRAAASGARVSRAIVSRATGSYYVELQRVEP